MAFKGRNIVDSSLFPVLGEQSQVIHSNIKKEQTIYNLGHDKNVGE